MPAHSPLISSSQDESTGASNDDYKHMCHRVQSIYRRV